MNNLTEIAEQTITRVLESAAFIFTDRLEERDRPQPGAWQAEGVSLRFSGKPSGAAHMWVSNGFACYTAANMLGLDQESPEAKQKGLDSLKELLNMIVGNFITAAYGDKPVFELGLPERTDAGLIERHGRSENALWLQAEGNPILFVFDIEPS